MEHARRRSGITTLLVLAATAFLAFSAFGPTGGPGSVDRAAADGPYGPSYKYCGTIRKYRYKIYAHHMSCRKAMRIQREFWLGPRRNKVSVNGGSGVYGYIKLKRYPGWRCHSGGSGGGSCIKGRQIAAYQWPRY